MQSGDTLEKPTAPRSPEDVRIDEYGENPNQPGLRYKSGFQNLQPRQGPMAQQSGKFTPERQAMYLFLLMETGMAGKSARKAGVSPSAVSYRTNPNSPGFDAEFRQQCEDAKNLYNESIEGEIVRRGVHGWKEPVFGGKDRDQIVGYVRKYSDQLLIQHAKARNPIYKDKIAITKEDDKTPATPLTEAMANLSREQRIKLGEFMKSLEPSDTIIDAVAIEHQPDPLDDIDL